MPQHKAPPPNRPPATSPPPDPPPKVKRRGYGAINGGYDKTPDIDLLPWVEREFTRIAYRHCDEDDAYDAWHLLTVAVALADCLYMASSL